MTVACAPSDTIRFYSKPTSELSDDEWNLCSDLYSNHYGVYGVGSLTSLVGKRVRMSPNYYRTHFIEPGYRVIIAEYKGIFVGQAFYLRDCIENDNFTWVLQLVVHSDYRKMGIGSKLLHSIWGFSNDSAWGLATANPFTVKTLEKTTLRHVRPEEIRKHDSLVREICRRVPYISSLQIDDTTSVANTDFFVDADGMKKEVLLSKFGEKWVLGTLPAGHEWVAFTFRDQPFDGDFTSEFNELISFSEERLKDAYSRMDMDDHPWSRHAGSEVAVLDSLCGGFSGKDVFDAGCGHGRHAISIAQKYPSSMVTGVDFSESNISSARLACVGVENVCFQVADLRNYSCPSSFDVILCLYDVVGSFPDDSDNSAILNTLASLCKKGGYLAISVMNLELTLSRALPENTGDILSHPEMIFRLPPADIMHKSGDIFDPRHYAVDPHTGVVYRKEQFADGESLPAEYVIRDRRYTRGQIESMVSDAGFEIVTSRYVRAGRWDECLSATDDGAKEILVIARRV